MLSKTKRNLALAGTALIFIILVLNPLNLTTIIVDNLGGSSEGELEVNWTLFDDQGNEIHDGDTVSGTLGVRAIFTVPTGWAVTSAELIVDGEHYADFYHDTTVGDKQWWWVDGGLDTTQLDDGEHEVQLSYDYVQPDPGGGGGGGHHVLISMLEFSIGAGGNGDGDGDGDNGDGGGFDWMLIGMFLFVVVAVGFFLIKKKKVRLR